MTTDVREKSDRDEGLRVGVPSGGRRSRRMWQSLGAVLLIGLGILAAMWWVTSQTVREPVGVLAADVAQGEVLETGDVAVAYVTVDPNVEVLSVDAARGLVGQRALADLSAGMLISDAVFAEEADLGPGEWSVGVLLPPGRLPSAGVRSGDRVAVLRTPRDDGELARLLRPANTDSLKLGEATVISVAELGSGDWWVTLRISDGAAEAVSAAASMNKVSLAVVPSTGGEQ